jgi:L-ascorbate metabolism protein UlaG (beta-lactamase superfamily)
MLERFTWFRQSAFLWKGDDANVYIDPWGLTVDDPADVILITHAHFDHFSMEDIDRIRKDGTKIFAPRDVADELSGDVVAVRPGEAIQAQGLKGETVPAYNIVEGRLDNHPKANEWVGYVLSLGSNTYYHAGDTDHLPELESVQTDVAFVPIGGTYTMDASEAARLVKAIGPQVAVPMHYGFVVASPSEADRFAKEADPVRVQALEPTNPFEQS